LWFRLMIRPLSQRNALITGVSRRVGIGAAIARKLAAAGAGIFTTYYRPYDQEVQKTTRSGDADAILEELRALGARAAGMEVDLSDVSAIQRVFDTAERQVGRIDVIVNNAVHDVRGDLLTMTAQSLDRHYAVNSRATALLCQEFARRHDGRPGGRIVNLTSGQSYHPMPDSLCYAMTKNAVEALTTCAAMTLGFKKITVNAVDPGGTDTGWMNESLKDELRRTNPLGRVGEPQDAANIILFLCTDDAQWINGQILRSRGGP
jgi:3-oxoacyl-[acyl-carrier protein] reductase